MRLFGSQEARLNKPESRDQKKGASKAPFLFLGRVWERKIKQEQEQEQEKSGA